MTVVLNEQQQGGGKEKNFGFFCTTWRRRDNQALLVVLHVQYAFLPSRLHIGLPGGPVPPAALGGPAAEPLVHQGGARLERPKPGEGHLEAGGLLPQCERRGVPVRDGAQRPSKDQAQRTDTLHAQVKAHFQYFRTISAAVEDAENFVLAGCQSINVCSCRLLLGWTAS